MIGRTLSRFWTTAKLDEDGGGEVDQAEDSVLGRYPELGAAYLPKNPRSIKRRAVLRAAAGYMIPFLVGFPLVVLGGVIRVTWGELLFALSMVIAVWSLMWCILVLGWDARLRFDPHFLLVPAAACATLNWLFVYLFPEIRLVVLQGWFVVLLFGAGLFSLRQVLALNTFMVAGYLGTIGFLAARGEPISWPFEIVMVILPFFLFTLFCATVLERLRRERADMKELRNQLSHLALTDRLTDLANRRHFDEYLRRHSALCLRSGATYSVGLIDVDRFKEINDSLGHAVGDGVLVQLASITRSRIRQSDLAARLGGDEFAVLIAETNATEASVVFSRILEAVASHCFSANNLLPGQVTVSIGVAENEDEELPSNVLRRADTELYAAKRDGRNRIAVSTSPHLPQVLPREV